MKSKSDDILVIENFHKRYGDTEAVSGIDLRVKKGELYGLIGPDGAGKTSLMRTVCTLLKPDSGKIIVNGLDVTKDVIAIRGILGYMPQRFSLYQDLSVQQNLDFFAEIFRVPQKEREKRTEQLFRFSRLSPFRSRKAGALSGGMKQKLALSCALIHTPEILILDEPTFGVDPVSRQEFWEILADIKKEGTTILVSTAYMDEANLCDRVALMHRGKLIAIGTPEELKSTFSYPLYRLRGRDNRQLRKFLSNLPEAYSTQLFGESVHASFLKEPSQSDWQNWKNNPDSNLQDWESIDPSVEDVFMEKISGENDDQ